MNIPRSKGNTPKEIKEKVVSKNIDIQKIFNLNELSERTIPTVEWQSFSQFKNAKFILPKQEGRLFKGFASFGLKNKDVMKSLTDSILSHINKIREETERTYDRFYLFLKDTKSNKFFLIEGQDNIKNDGSFTPIEVSKENLLKIDINSAPLESLLTNKSRGVYIAIDAIAGYDLGAGIVYDENKRVQLALILDNIDDTNMDERNWRNVAKKEIWSLTQDLQGILEKEEENLSTNNKVNSILSEQ